MDAMQDTFVQVLRRERALDERAPSSLLYTIATNVCLNVLRSDRSRPRSAGAELLDTIAGPDDPARRAVDSHRLARIFAKEKPSTRVIAVMHFVDGLTYEETAAEVGLSVSGVRKRLRSLRARARALEEG